MSRAAALCLVTAALAALGGCGNDALNQPQPDMTVLPDLVVLPDLTPTRSGIGDECTSLGGIDQGSCNDGQLCIPDGFNGFGGGYCTQQCSTSSPCPQDARCIPVTQSMSFCFARCNGDSDCRAGYECNPSARVCLPVDNGGGVPPGTKNNMACVQPVVSPSQGKTLFGQDARISTSLGMQGIEAETHLAVDAVAVPHRVVVSYIAVGSGGASKIGVVTSATDGMGFLPQTVLPADNTVVKTSDMSDPVVAVDKKGSFYITWLGFDRTGGGAGVANMQLYVAKSVNGGVSFDKIFIAAPLAEWKSGGFIDKPWIAVSPLDDSVWITWMRQVSQQSVVEIRTAFSKDGGVTWSTPITISDGNLRPFLARNLANIAIGADGRPAVSWVEIDQEQFGATANRIYFQRLAADGTKVGSNVRVSGQADSPAFDDTAIAVDGDRVYVGFVSGTPSGAWDVKVSASIDAGVTWMPSVKVNDDPTCATHFHPKIAVDGKGRVHAVWYDGRYYPQGNVMHAASTMAGMGAPLAFGENTFVNKVSHQFTTRRDMSNWVGDYLGIVAAGTDLYAAWTDPRTTNVSHVYFAKGQLP